MRFIRFVGAAAVCLVLRIPGAQGGGSTGVGSGYAPNPVLDGHYQIQKAADWSLVEDNSTFSRLVSANNELVFEKTGDLCGAPFHETQPGVEIADCGPTRSLIRTSVRELFEARYKAKDAAVDTMMNSFVPIFKTGAYRVTIFWNDKLPRNVMTLPPPYREGDEVSSMSMHVTYSPKQASDQDHTMAGYHQVRFDYKPTSLCTDQGIGYSWSNGSFWFGNCDPRPNHFWGGFYYLYLRGTFTDSNRGQGDVCLVRPEGPMDCAPQASAVGTFCMDPVEQDGSAKVCGRVSRVGGSNREL